MNNPLFSFGEEVYSPFGRGVVKNLMVVQGDYFYHICIHDGWYIDIDDGSRRYDSNLIAYKVIREEDLQKI